MNAVRVRIINNWTGNEKYVFNVEIDRSSDSWHRQLGETRKRLKDYKDLLVITDHDYVLNLLRQHKDCQICVG